MLFLASCSEGFVRKLGGGGSWGWGGGILSMAVAMWGVGYNGGGFSRQSHTPDLGHFTPSFSVFARRQKHLRNYFAPRFCLKLHPG